MSDNYTKFSRKCSKNGIRCELNAWGMITVTFKNSLGEPKQFTGSTESLNKQLFSKREEFCNWRLRNGVI